MNFYELAYIIPATTEEKDQSDIRNKVSKTIGEHKGNIIAEPPSEKRKLSYIIQRTRQGVFQYIRFSADTDTVGEITNDLKLIPELLRYQVVKLNASSPTEVKSTATPNPIPVQNTREEKKEEKKEEIKTEDKKEKTTKAKAEKPEEAKEKKQDADEPTTDEPQEQEKAKGKSKEEVNLDELDKKIDKILEGDIA